MEICPKKGKHVCRKRPRLIIEYTLRLYTVAWTERTVLLNVELEWTAGNSIYGVIHLTYSEQQERPSIFQFDE